METYGILNAIAITLFAVLGIYVFAKAAKHHTHDSAENKKEKK